MLIMRCKHCKNRTSYGRRGLCRACHGDIRIRRHYPQAGRSPITPDHPASVDAGPTSAFQGSEGKMLVMQARQRLGLELFSDRDGET